MVGFVSNGEYNVFRHKGYTRPLSVFQIQSQARKKYSTTSEKKMKEMFTTIGKTLPLHKLPLTTLLHSTNQS